MTARTPRMPMIPDAEMTEAQKAAVKDIVSGPRGHLVGPFIPLLRSPDFMTRLQKTGEYLRFNSALEPRRSEMVILMTARLWTQAFEWHHHRPIAEKAGLAADVIDAIAEGRRPAKMAADEAVIYDFIDELSRARSVSDATYKRAVEAFGERGVIDMIGIHGYYSLLAMVLNVSRAPLPEGAKTGIDPLP
ncbi:carboxymuconolactone decarboxylase family protein [Hyphomicrobium sp. CS1BSMeth3]|uniref:carboxymuconolactone decarboxylase family protein n=1 Tax=Hyphomicrobium sp. CS1BSMeth3 TaxID=1892844 RepID=UPI000930D940|nr:carboxymuconolactone decarboxylase family protein [Hyphomicrobium sp. CS1BSMeth3]